MAVGLALILSLSLQSVLANVEPRQASGYYSNATITAPPSSIATPTSNGSAVHNDCCFLVQDTVTDNYWAHYTTSTWYGLRSITSIITSVTQYADTAITNYETATTIKNSTYLLTSQIGINNVGTYNDGYGPYVTTSMINATATSMYGTILTSPAGFYVIPTVKVIRVPAVTQANGQLACTTTSRWSLLCGAFGATASPYPTTVRTTAVFTGMNDQMQAYYSGQQGPSIVPMGTYQETLSRAPTNTTGYPSTTVISFSTPYLYFPPKAATEAEFFDTNHVIYPASIPGAVTTSSTPSPTTTISLTSTVTYTYSSTANPPIDTLNLNYGFIPPGIVSWMLQNPDYANQYPGLESCLPGGPSITPNTACASVAPATAEVVPDLTTSGATTVQGLGCFHPGNCPAAAATTKAPEPAVSAAAVQASSTAPLLTASFGTSVTVAALPEHSQVQSKHSTVNPMSIIAPIPVVPTSDAQTSAPSQSKQPLPSQQAQQSEHRTSNSDSGAGLNPQTGISVNAADQKTTPTSVMPIQPAPSVKSTSPAQNLQSASSLPVIIIASSTIALDSSSNFVFGSDTIIPGGNPTVTSSSTISLAPSASALIVNGATSTIAPPPSSPSPSSLASPPNLASIIAGAFTGHPAITALSQTISADSSSQFIIGSQTLAPGSSPLTISGSTFSLAPSASAIIINGITSALFVTPHPIPQHPTNPVLTLPSSSLLSATPTSPLVYIFAAQTLIPGGPPITINSTPMSLPPSASALLVGTQTQPLPPGSPPVLTLGSQTLTASTASAQAYLVGGQTLLPGGAAATVNGVEVSIAPSGTAVVVGGVTEGFASPSGNGSAYAGPGFTGGASEGSGRGWGRALGFGLGVMVMVMW